MSEFSKSKVLILFKIIPSKPYKRNYFRHSKGPRMILFYSYHSRLCITIVRTMMLFMLEIFFQEIWITRPFLLKKITKLNFCVDSIGNTPKISGKLGSNWIRVEVLVRARAKLVEPETNRRLEQIQFKPKSDLVHKICLCLSHTSFSYS